MLAIVICTYSCSTSSHAGVGFWKQYRQSNASAFHHSPFLPWWTAAYTNKMLCKQSALYTNPHAGLSASPCVMWVELKGIMYGNAIVYHYSKDGSALSHMLTLIQIGFCGLLPQTSSTGSPQKGS